MKIDFSGITRESVILGLCMMVMGMVINNNITQGYRYGCYTNEMNTTKICGTYEELVKNDLIPKYPNIVDDPRLKPGLILPDAAPCIIVQNNTCPTCEAIGSGTDLTTITILFNDTTTTTLRNCPTMVIPEDIAKQAFKIRLPDASPCQQDGCIKCLRKEWELLNMPGRPKYNPGESRNFKDIYDQT